MNAISAIQDKLSKYNELKYNIENNCITIDAPTKTGFTVWLTENNPGFTVGFDGWHEEFSDQDEALDCFAFGLSDQCRLKVTKRGDFSYNWVVESKIDNQWVEDSESGLIFVPFWKKKSVIYLTNSIIKGS